MIRSFPMFSAVSLLLCACPVMGGVGERYEEFAAKVGAAQESNTRGEATMAVHAINDKGVLVVHVGGVIATEAYEGVADLEAAKAILAKQGNGKIAEAGSSFPDTHFRTADGTYRAVYRGDAKVLMVFFWPLYSTKVQKETRK